MRACRRIFTRGVIGVLACTGASWAGAEPCTVPGTHGSIQAAIDNAGCDPIQLQAGDYLESPVIDRDLTLVGAGPAATTIRGQVTAEGAGVLAFVDALQVVSGCPGPALQARGGATLNGDGLQVARSASAGCNGAAGIFTDGFE